MPINYAGLALIAGGVAVLVGEALLPSFGALGIGGLLAFIIGSVMLLETEAPGYGFSFSVIAAFSAMSALFFFFVIGLAIMARQRPVVSGREELVGSVGSVLEDFDRRGFIRVHGEVWTAVSDRPLRKDQRVRVVKLDDLSLLVLF